MNPFKAMRERSGLKQISVAEALNVKQTTISMWETGESKPHADTLIELAELYNCSIDELLGRNTA